MDDLTATNPCEPVLIQEDIRAPDAGAHGRAPSEWQARALVLIASIMWSTSGFFVKSPYFTGWAGPLLAFWRAMFACLVLWPMVRQPSWNWRLVPELNQAEEKLGSRPSELEELRFALEASIVAAEKGLAGIEYLRYRERPEEAGGRKSLAKELQRIERAQKRLQKRLRKLWLARNRTAGFEKMRAQYRTSIRGLRRAARELAAGRRKL